MHIPDGFLDLKTAIGTGALALAGLGLALRHASQTLSPRKVPLLGLSAAFVFAAQMINFPIGAGTSGHLMGGVLTAALLGPSAAVVVISCVLIVQCLMFADGGITALGANIFNMAIIGGAVGWMIYALVSRMIKGLFGQIVASVVAAWCSVVLASVICAGELAFSGTIKASLVLPAMAWTHMIIGIGEGVITALVLSGVAATRSDLILPETQNAPAFRPILIMGLIASLGIALFLSPFASTSPDGLDKAAQDLQFEQRASEHRALPAPAPDYKMPGVSSEVVATSIAGGVGALVVFGGALLLARTLLPKTKTDCTASK